MSNPNGMDESPEANQQFERFVHTHLERARRLTWRLIGGDLAATDDVVQDALLRAYRALPGFRGEAKLETWFYRILVRQAQNYRRWSGLRLRWMEALDGEHAAAESDPGDPLLRARVAAAMAVLSPAQRDAFTLVHLEQFTVREAAHLLGKREGTLKTHLKRALATLRKELGDLKCPTN